MRVFDSMTPLPRPGSAAQNKRKRAAGYQRMSSFRQGLPAWGYSDTIVDMVRDNQV